MYTPMITSILALLITTLLFMLAKILNNRSVSDREKTSPFECGFDPKNNARVPFSLRFFMLAIIFIVFDIEIVLLMPTPLLSLMMNTSQSLMTAMMFMMILLIGLFHEWKEGSLSWSS
nr:NADH dehydrogenase subunit 3 [Nais communis]